MDLKKLLLPLMVLLLMATASATVTTTINTPTANQTFLPNQSQDSIDINFNVVDDNTANPIHQVTIVLGTRIGNDANITIVSDQNLGQNQCGGKEVGWDGGITCLVRYTFPTAQGQIIDTGNYVIDVNVVAITDVADQEVTDAGFDEDLQQITIDNRYVSAAVEALLNVAPVVLVAAVVVAAVLALAGVISAKVALMASIGAAVAVVAVLVFATILEILTP